MAPQGSSVDSLVTKVTGIGKDGEMTALEQALVLLAEVHNTGESFGLHDRIRDFLMEHGYAEKACSLLRLPEASRHPSQI